MSSKAAYVTNAKPLNHTGAHREGAVVKCIMCGKPVTRAKFGFAAHHVTPGNQRCIGVGMSWVQASNQRRLIENMARNRKPCKP